MAKVKKHRLVRVQLIGQQISVHPFKIPMKVKHRLHQISLAQADRKKNRKAIFSTTTSFQKNWLRDFKWLKFQEDNNSMSCTLCIKHKKSNALTGDCRNFKTSTLTRNADNGGPISKENCSCHLRVNRLMMLILQVILTFDKRSVNS